MSEAHNTAAGYELDARGLLCPMPVIRAQQRIEDLASGDQLTVFCTVHKGTDTTAQWSGNDGLYLPSTTTIGVHLLAQYSS